MKSFNTIIRENYKNSTEKKPHEDFKHVHEFAKNNNIDLHIIVKKNSYHLQWLAHKKWSSIKKGYGYDDSEVNKGAGTKTLKMINDVADKHKKDVTLQVFNKQPHLFKLYKDHGYEPYNNKKDEKSYGPWMIRKGIK